MSASESFSRIQNKAPITFAMGALFWLRNRDSNPNKQIQRLRCYHYTIPQYLRRSI